MEKTDNQVKSSISKQFLKGVGLLSIGLLIWVTCNMSTVSYVGYGVVMTLLIGIPCCIIISPIILTLWWIIRWCEKRKRTPGWITSQSIKYFFRFLLVLSLVKTIYDSMPATRCSEMTGVARSKAKNVKAAGYFSFLASRWNFTFNATKTDLEPIFQKWNLESTAPFKDQKDVFGNDFIFEHNKDFKNSPSLQELEFFISSKAVGVMASQDVQLVFHPSSGQVWFLYAYQN